MISESSKYLIIIIAYLYSISGRSLDSTLEEVDLSINRLFHWGAYADKYGGGVQETPLYGTTLKIHEPVGVIGTYLFYTI